MTIREGGSYGKESAYDAGNPDLIPGWGRFPGEGNGHPLQYSCLKNPVDVDACWATVHGVTELATTEHSSTAFSWSEMQGYGRKKWFEWEKCELSLSLS